MASNNRVPGFDDGQQMKADLIDIVLRLPEEPVNSMLTSCADETRPMRILATIFRLVDPLLHFIGHSVALYFKHGIQIPPHNHLLCGAFYATLKDGS